MNKTEQRITVARTAEELAAIESDVLGYKMNGKNKLRVSRAFTAAYKRLGIPAPGTETVTTIEKPLPETIPDSGPGRFPLDEAEKHETRAAVVEKGWVEPETKTVTKTRKTAKPKTDPTEKKTPRPRLRKPIIPADTATKNG